MPVLMMITRKLLLARRKATLCKMQRISHDILVQERDQMAPDAVQYARALRPPYHLLSFLRIKGHSTKGMSCTDKNTMVFVVLEGEITVVLHTTQFNAKKGDSFYIPPKNYYNLINQNAREAELSLIQFQYDGPLPTVPAGSQSGLTKPATQDAAS